MNLYLNGYKSSANNVKKHVALEAIKIYPYDAAFWNGLTIVTKDPHKKLQYALKATELNPEFSYAWSGLGNAYLALNDHPKAIVAWQKQLSLNPTAISSMIAIGSNYIKIKKYKASIPYFDKAIAQEPNNFIAHLDRGYAYVFLGDTDKAMADELIAQKLEPNDASSYLNMGLIYKKLGNMKLAKHYYDKGLSLEKSTKDKNEDLKFFEKIK